MTHPTPIKDTPANILYRASKALQQRDIKNGYSNHEYMDSYWEIVTNGKPLGLSLSDILTDAWNCKLITDAEYEYILLIIN